MISAQVLLLAYYMHNKGRVFQMVITQDALLLLLQVQLQDGIQMTVDYFRAELHQQSPSLG